MSYVKMQGMMINALDGNTLVFVALGIFLTIVVISAITAYLIACGKNKNTQMTGLIQVAVALNEWPESETAGDCPRLVFGEYLISMKDPDAVKEDRLDPRLTGMQQAYCRKSWVGELLRRFHANFESCGMQGDAGCRLLQDLLKDNNFCVSLGQLYRTNSKKGLRVARAAKSAQDKLNLDKVSVYARIPEEIANTYRAATGCDAQMLCITMEYHSRNRIESGV